MLSRKHHQDTGAKEKMHIKSRQAQWAKGVTGQNEGF